MFTEGLLVGFIYQFDVINLFVLQIHEEDCYKENLTTTLCCSEDSIDEQSWYVKYEGKLTPSKLAKPSQINY